MHAKNRDTLRIVSRTPIELSFCRFLLFLLMPERNNSSTIKKSSPKNVNSLVSHRTCCAAYFVWHSDRNICSRCGNAADSHCFASFLLVFHICSMIHVATHSAFHVTYTHPPPSPSVQGGTFAQNMKYGFLVLGSMDRHVELGIDLHR